MVISEHISCSGTKQNTFGFFKYQTENREQSKPKLEN
jgi:hypothetical protein